MMTQAKKVTLNEYHVMTIVKQTWKAARRCHNKTSPIAISLLQNVFQEYIVLQKYEFIVTFPTSRQNPDRE